jgi:glutathione peroxidase
MSQATIYDFIARTPEGENIPMEHYRNQVLLIVNTASQCRFTPQYGALETLHELYYEKGLRILAFPSNEFGGQEPLNGNDIKRFCADNYHVAYDIFDKVHVRGDAAIPLFRWLTQKKLNGKMDVAIRWNFYKFLVGRDGKFSNFYYPFTSPLSARVRQGIVSLL